MADHTAGHLDLGGEANFVVPAELIGHPARSAIMLALLDGRALPMSVLASEAGVALSTASAHLARLVDGGLLQVTAQGRHRYYSLSSPQVAEALEALARLTKPAPVASLRADRRARALRAARTCYDHIAGQLGVELMQALLRNNVLAGGDGRFSMATAHHDRLSAPGSDIPYYLTVDGAELMDSLGVAVQPTKRPLVRYCVDWTEQHHHLGGALGAALLVRFEALDWIERGHSGIRRALLVTQRGCDDMAAELGLDMAAIVGPAAA